MNTLFVLILFAVVALLAFWLLIGPVLARRDRKRFAELPNVGGTHQDGLISRIPDAAVASRHLLAKVGSDEDHLAICGAGDDPIGTWLDEADAAAVAAGENRSVELFGGTRKTKLVVASETITAGERVYPAANGEVQDAPATGVHYCIGRALRDAVDGDVFEIEPAFPTPVNFG